MSREKKAQIIDMLQEEISNCSIGILTDYRGLSNLQITALRRRLQETGSHYRVVKNTLARFAAERAGREHLVSSLEGPVAIAFSYGSLTEAAKILADYIRTSGASVSIKGGFLANRMLTAEEVMNLSTLPPREILLANLVSRMKSPLWGLAICLASPMRGLLGVLQARIQQLEGA
jgi:large subunit ribosomal protein L10